MKNIKTWRERTAERGIGSCEARDEEIEELRAQLAAMERQEPVELVLTFNYGTLVKAEFQDNVLYEVDLSPKPYFQVCWASGWGGDYASEEDARNECLSLCGYGRSIREVKPGDGGYKDPRYLSLVEQRIPLYAAPCQVEFHTNSAQHENATSTPQSVEPKR